MVLFWYIYVFILWLLFWSFSSVIIDRLRNKKSWIFTWRSECPICKHKLNAIDLIPLFSFLSTKWKCRYCHSKISKIYPILELCMWLLFVLTGYFLIDLGLIFNWNIVEIYKLIFFLLFWLFTIIYVLYDILYFEIPDSILAIWSSITFITVSLQSLIPNFKIINLLPTYNNLFSYEQIAWLICFAIISIIWFYVIMLKELKEIYDLLILSILIFIWIFIKYYLHIDLEQTAIWSGIISSFIVFIFLFLQIVLSGWKWMWWWDLRIATGPLWWFQYKF